MWCEQAAISDGRKGSNAATIHADPARDFDFGEQGGGIACGRAKRIRTSDLLHPMQAL
jgi:hypothetical protein